MTKRIPEIDFLRGLAVAGMLVFHTFFILDYYDVLQNEMYTGGFLWLLNFVRFTFIGLVGISLVLANQRGVSTKKLLKRGLYILFLGYLITLVTFIFVPEEFVRFGILHLIGLGIIVFAGLTKYKYSSFAVGLLILLAYPFIDNIVVDLGILNYIAYLLGILGQQIPTLDYYPIFPWFALISFGIFLGNVLYEDGKRKHKSINFFAKLTSAKAILFMGRNSLLIYMVHIPLIVGMVWILF